MKYALTVTYCIQSLLFASMCIAQNSKPSATNASTETDSAPTSRPFEEFREMLLFDIRKLESLMIVRSTSAQSDVCALTESSSAQDHLFYELSVRCTLSKEVEETLCRAKPSQLVIAAKNFRPDGFGLGGYDGITITRFHKSLKEFSVSVGRIDGFDTELIGSITLISYDDRRSGSGSRREWLYVANDNTLVRATKRTLAIDAITGKISSLKECIDILDIPNERIDSRAPIVLLRKYNVSNRSGDIYSPRRPADNKRAFPKTPPFAARSLLVQSNADDIRAFRIEVKCDESEQALSYFSELMVDPTLDKIEIFERYSGRVTIDASYASVMSNTEKKRPIGYYLCYAMSIAFGFNIYRR